MWTSIIGHLLRMEGEELSRPRDITEPRAAAALGDPFLRRLVLSLVPHARSISELAVMTEVDPKRLHYHVTRLARLGLLEVAGERKRTGRAIKLYRASAARFFIPFEVAPEPLTEGLSRELRKLLWDEHLRMGDGMILETDERGIPKMRLISQRLNTAVRASESWQILRLTGMEAEALRQDLQSVVARHAAQSTAGGKPHLVHMAIAKRTATTVNVDNPGDR